MTLFALIKQWLAEQPELEYVSKSSKTGNIQIIVVSLADNQFKMMLIVVYDNYITTSKGNLYASNPKFFSLLKKRLLKGLRG